MNTAMPSWPNYSFRAMGSQITLWLETDVAHAHAAFAQAEALFATNERALSRFDETSELSALNRHPNDWFDASPLLWDVVTRALALAARTDGLFDPTQLNALEAAGYTRSFALMQAEREQTRQLVNVQLHTPLHAPLQYNGWATVQLDQTRSAIKLLPGVRLDLGGIGKGYTAQACVRLLAPWGPCLVDAGGDVVAGSAPQGLPGWPVAVAAPSSGDDATQGRPTTDDELPDASSDDLLELWLAEATLATSGVDYRRWQQAGQWRHHLIDPRTGEPAVTDLLTATVLHGSAVDAEAWAKAALLLGMQAGFERLVQEQVAGVLATVDGQVSTTPTMVALTSITL